MLAKTRDELLTQNKKNKTKRKDNNGYNLASSTETFTSNTSSKISTYLKRNLLLKSSPRETKLHSVKSPSETKFLERISTNRIYQET